MAKDEFRCAHALRVRWAEVDMQKVVFNAHYLTYIDTAIGESLGARSGFRIPPVMSIATAPTCSCARRRSTTSAPPATTID